MHESDRRSMMTLAALAATIPGAALAQSLTQGNAPSAEMAPTGPEPMAKHSIDFGVIGLDHAHIYGMTDAMIRGGGKLKAFYATDPAQIRTFKARYDDVKLARSEDEIMDDRGV